MSVVSFDLDHIISVPDSFINFTITVSLWQTLGMFPIYIAPDKVPFQPKISDIFL